MFSNVLDRDLALCEAAKSDEPTQALGLLDALVENPAPGPYDLGAAAALLLMLDERGMAAEVARRAVASEGPSSSLGDLVLLAITQGMPALIVREAIASSEDEVRRMIAAREQGEE